MHIKGTHNPNNTLTSLICQKIYEKNYKFTYENHGFTIFLSLHDPRSKWKEKTFILEWLVDGYQSVSTIGTLKVSKSSVDKNTTCASNSQNVRLISFEHTYGGKLKASEASKVHDFSHVLIHVQGRAVVTLEVWNA